MPRYITVPAISLPPEDEQAPPRLPPTAPAVAAEAVDAAVVEPIMDPPGQVVEIDGRVLSERLMFSYGFNGWTFQEIAGELAASVLWVEVAVRQNPWLEEARVAGVQARNRDLGTLSVRSLEKLVKGYKLDQQKVTKDGLVVDFKEAFGPNAAAVTKALETLEKKTFGKEAPAVTINVGMDALAGALERAKGAQAVEFKEV